MATNREMLKEAIADAKAVKETAIANAKSALEEAFTPQLKSMFAAKLQEMESDEDEMNEIEGFGDFDTKDNAGFSKMGEKALDEMDDEKMMEVDLEELLAELNDEEMMDESLNEAEEGEEDMEMSDEESEESEEEGEPIDLEDLTDEDLKDMIEDVIKDMIEKGELEAGNEDMEGEESEESEESEEEVDLAELLREIEEMDDVKEMEEPMDEIIDTSQVSDLAGQLAVSIPFLIGGGALLGTYLKNKFSKKSPAEVKAISKDILANPEKYKAEAEKSDGKSPEIAEMSTEKNSELSEAYSTIKILKSELNEINLLNAKLLYTNKIFKAKNLNESQKVKVLTSFDRAKNVGEVKMVFETLNEGIKVSKNIIKENLGRASKGTMTPNVKKPIVESNEAFLRMQKLAGII
jgi:hypothetical protein